MPSMTTLQELAAELPKVAAATGNNPTVINFAFSNYEFPASAQGAIDLKSMRREDRLFLDKMVEAMDQGRSQSADIFAVLSDTSLFTAVNRDELLAIAKATDKYLDEFKLAAWRCFRVDLSECIWPEVTLPAVALPERIYPEPPVVVAEQPRASTWGFCNDSNHQAFADRLYTIRKPEADVICSLPTAGEANVIAANQTRCEPSMSQLCSADAGGIGQTQNIPAGAWYELAPDAASTSYQGAVRCSCGCFTGDVQLLTSNGWQEIAELATKTASLKPRLQIPFADTFASSSQLNANAFTVGPEEELLRELTTASGAKLTLTGTHPVVVVINGKEEMRTAAQVIPGVILLTTDGQETPVLTAKSFKPSNAPLVYNVDTMGSGAAAHVIVANGLRMGDLAWQQKLSETASRAANLLKYANNAAQ